jgi:phytoene/squalene synthetase
MRRSDRRANGGSVTPANPPDQPAASKTAREENFPVVSLLMPARIRAVVMAYYHFARHADDVADSESLSPDAKVAALDALDAVLAGAEAQPAQDTAARYRAAVNADPRLLADASNLLVAFRRDAVRNHTRDWDDLLEYCRYSAAPVGRFLLDLHGESAETHAASDALCAALQILNHLQDCAQDLRRLDRS